MRVVADGGHDEICAVCGDHRRLCKSGTGVVFLYDGVYAHDRDDDTQSEIERDEETIEGTCRAGKVGIQHAREGDGKSVHECSGPDEDPLPEVGGSR